MKQLLMPPFIMLIGIGFISYGVVNNKVPERRQKRTILQSTTDERNLTSVIYLEGKDTLALDYLTSTEFNKLFK